MAGYKDGKKMKIAKKETVPAHRPWRRKQNLVGAVKHSAISTSVVLKDKGHLTLPILISVDLSA